jgi:hypothetical protein
MQYELLYAAIVADTRYRANLSWGEAREGHPEGTIAAHIAELEGNLAKLEHVFSKEDVWKLRVLIHTHDTFKPESQEGVAISHPQSHASLARAFLAQHGAGDDVQVMAQLHDEPFALFRQAQFKGSYNTARMEALIVAIRDWRLFLAFLIIDGCTAGKERESLRWFFKEIEGRVTSDVNASHIV